MFIRNVIISTKFLWWKHFSNEITINYKKLIVKLKMSIFFNILKILAIFICLKLSQL